MTYEEYKASNYFIDVCETVIGQCDTALDMADSWADAERFSAKRARHVNMQAVAFAVREGL